MSFRQKLLCKYCIAQNNCEQSLAKRVELTERSTSFTPPPMQSKMRFGKQTVLNSFAKLGFIGLLLLVLCLPLNAQTEKTKTFIGDTNNDGVVDITDSRNIAADLGGPPTGNYGNTDLNNDGVVDKLDVILLADGLKAQQSLSVSELIDSNNSALQGDSVELESECDSIGLTNGDYNADNVIDDFDLNAVNGVFGSNGEWPVDPEMNGDGIIDDFELIMIAGSYGDYGDTVGTATITKSYGDYAVRFKVNLNDWFSTSPYDSWSVRTRARKLINGQETGDVYESVHPVTGEDYLISVRVPELADYRVEVRSVVRNKPTGAQNELAHWLSKTVDMSSVWAPSETAGTTYSWEKEVSGVNTNTGNRLTTISLANVGTRGAVPLAFSLYHNSTGNSNSELGAKWTHTYNNNLTFNECGDAVVTWGNGKSYIYQYRNSEYTPPVGIYDTLTEVGSPISAYEIKTKSQIIYRFTQPNNTAWVCTEIEDLNGNIISIDYDTVDRVEDVYEPANRGLAFTYDINTGLLSTIGGVNGNINISYTLNTNDNKYNLTQITNPDVTVNGTPTTYHYHFQYDQDGNANHHNITTYMDLMDNAYAYEYDARDRALTITDPCNNETQYAYGANYADVTDANNHTTRHTYTTGLITQVTDPLQYVYSYEYDYLRNLSSMEDQLGSIWSYPEYDSRGNKLTHIDPLNHVWTYEYNNLNKMTVSKTPLNNKTEWDYDSCGNLLTKTWFEWNSQTQTYSEITSESYGYPTPNYGKPSSKTDGNNHTTYFTHNNDGYLTQLETPEGKIWQWAYNASGILTQSADPKYQTISYSLDEWGRVIGKTYPDYSTATYEYDANSNILETTDSIGTTTWEYDSLNRKTSESKDNLSIDYVYDGTGRKGLLSSMTDWNNVTTAYTYTSRNELYTVSDSYGTATYEYDEAGHEVFIENPNGTTTTKTYDDLGRITSIINEKSDQTLLSSYVYSYRDDNQLTGVVEDTNDTETFTYDAMKRLTSASRTGNGAYSESYVLDGASNRTRKTAGGVNYDYEYNDDGELLNEKIGGVTQREWTYDDNGNQITRNWNSDIYDMEYDFDNRLITTKIGQNTITVFEYDVFGRRAERTNSNVTTQYLFDGWSVVNEKQNQNITSTYRYGNQLIRYNNDVPLFDRLGSTRLITSSTETITGRRNYKAFGETAYTNGSTDLKYGWNATQGQRTDGDAGLIYIRHRYYDPQVGRFVSRDTIPVEKPFPYCEADPVMLTEVNGRNQMRLFALLTCLFVGEQLPPPVVLSPPETSVVTTLPPTC